MSKYIEITKEEAKARYIDGEYVYISNDKRQYWRMPASYEYASHAPVNELFLRGLPENEGENRFYKTEK